MAEMELKGEKKMKENLVDDMKYFIDSKIQARSGNLWSNRRYEAPENRKFRKMHGRLEDKMSSKHRKILVGLREENRRQEQRIKELNQTVQDLKSLVCEENPKAEVCR